MYLQVVLEFDAMIMCTVVFVAVLMTGQATPLLQRNENASPRNGVLYRALNDRKVVYNVYLLLTC
jgi:hypothetical protein